jgi:hypothetical protein
MATAPASPQNSKPYVLRHSKGTLIRLAVLIFLGESVGLLGFYFARNPDLARIFATGAITLFFGALLGGVVQVLVSDLELQRTNRAAEADFISNLLADLKSVYDRVERARTLITANRSAKTYGEEMRDLIESRVKLLNVVRALENYPLNLSAGKIGDPGSCSFVLVRADVEEMEAYLAEIVSQFRQNYRSTSDLQRVFEAQVKRALDAGEVPTAQKAMEADLVWKSISALSAVEDWLSMNPVSRGRPRELAPSTKPGLPTIWIRLPGNCEPAFSRS